MKTSKDFLTEANAAVPRISAGEAIAAYNAGGGIFIDVRDSGDIAKSGTIKGALRIPRGFMEFAADDNSPYHEESLTKDAELFLVCGAGGQAALCGKTLKDMGFTSVTNIGGFKDWADAGGATED